MADWRAVWVAIEAGLFQHGDDAVAAGLPWLTERAKEEIARAAMRAAGVEAARAPSAAAAATHNGAAAH